jgi:hypothetical protein
MAERRRRRKASNIGAGVAGSGGGALLAHLASHVAGNPWWKPYAIDLAPFVALAMSGSLVFLRENIKEYWARKRKDSFFRTAKQTLVDGVFEPRMQSNVT